LLQLAKAPCRGFDRLNRREEQKSRDTFRIPAVIADYKSDRTDSLRQALGAMVLRRGLGYLWLALAFWQAKE